GKVKSLTVKASGIENSRRETIIIKVDQAYHWYRKMIQYYGVSTLVHYLSESGEALNPSLIKKFRFDNLGNWINVGGQLIHEADLEGLKQAVKQHEINSWEGVHARYQQLGEAYVLDKVSHAWRALL